MIFIKLLFIFLSLNSYAEICIRGAGSGEIIKILGQENSCEQDLQNGGIALLNSINESNLQSHTPSNTELNIASTMLNYLTKNIVQISQLDQLTTGFGNGIDPSGEVGRYCSLDQLNSYINCPRTYSQERVQALFGEPIEEVISKHFVGELMKSRNENSENTVTQCLSSQDKSLLNQQFGRINTFKRALLFSGSKEWDAEKHQFKDNSLNLALENNPEEFVATQLGFGADKGALPYLRNMLKDKQGVIAFFDSLHTFKSNNPNINMMKRENIWSFYKSLFNDSDLVTNMRGSLASQCQNMFENFGNFICNPATFHASNNDQYNNRRVASISTDNDNIDFDRVNYIDYLYFCQGEHCFQENHSLVRANYCTGIDNTNSFQINDFLQDAQEVDIATISQTDNSIYRNDNIYGETNNYDKDICESICMNQPQCSPKKTALQIKEEFKCGESDEKAECTTSIKAWLEIQEMKESYSSVIAQTTLEGNSGEAGENGESTQAQYSPFFNHFLGNIGQDVVAGKTPTLTGIKREDRTPVDRQTLAEAAEGRSDFDTPDRNRNREATTTGGGRRSLTDTLADIQNRRTTTTAAANFNGNQMAKNNGVTRGSFTPLQPGSLGSQIASTISTSDRDRFIEENSRLMRDILRGQNDSMRGTLNTLDNVLANNEKRFNTGVNVNNNIQTPQAPKRRGSGDTVARKDGGVLGVGDQPIAAPEQVANAEGVASSGGSGGSNNAGTNNVTARGTSGNRGPASTSGPGKSGPSVSTELDSLETITLEELQRQNISLDKPFILVINNGTKSVRVRVIPMQHNGKTILAPDITDIGEDEYFVYPLLKKAAVFQEFFTYREERLNSIRAI